MITHERKNDEETQSATKSTEKMTYCRQCGAPLNLTRRNRMRRFCNEKCRQKWWACGGIKSTDERQELKSSDTTIKTVGTVNENLPEEGANIGAQPLTTRTEAIVLCRYCGKHLILTSTNRMKRFCGENCRLKWWRANKKIGSESNPCISGRNPVKYIGERERQAIVEYCTGDESIKEVALRYGFSESDIRTWKRELLGKEHKTAMQRRSEKEQIGIVGGRSKAELEDEFHRLQETNEALKQKNAELEKRNYRLQVEYDVLEKAAEIIKNNRAPILRPLAIKKKPC